MTITRSLRILLAEDNPGDILLVRKALSRYSIKHELTVAQDGDAAWKLIESAANSRTGYFDVVILDLNLPARPGLEILERIRGCRGRMSRAIVVVSSSSSAPPDRDAAARAGADHYFCKPSSLEPFLELGAVVRNLCDSRRDSTNRRNTGKGATL